MGIDCIAVAVGSIVVEVAEGNMAVGVGSMVVGVEVGATIVAVGWIVVGVGLAIVGGVGVSNDVVVASASVTTS